MEKDARRMRYQAAREHGEDLGKVSQEPKLWEEEIERTEKEDGKRAISLLDVGSCFNPFCRLLPAS